ncbi:Cyclin-dependent kinase F-1 [Platanthera guangdongensis]|uniref:Cyclin-dependent kinase F-1 n=1 Tax=Platanthera guangdongensis TaxID=2320717 RepID=A0ABR2M152_9ASPA
MAAPPLSSRSWTIYGRSDITDHYEILDRIGPALTPTSTAAAGTPTGSSSLSKKFTTIRAPSAKSRRSKSSSHAPNVVDLIDYFWQEDDDAVLVLEYLHADLAAVIRDGKKAGGLLVGEVKQWMLQILAGVDACHRNLVVHRDLKPSNLLISADWVLKLVILARYLLISKLLIITTLQNKGRKQSRCFFIS